MAKKQNANLEKLFQEALCKQIGEQRYQSWFGVGVRFDFSGDALDVQVKSEFLYSMLRSAYTHILAQVAYDLLGRAVPVKILYVGKDASESGTASQKVGAFPDDATLNPVSQARSANVELFFPSIRNDSVQNGSIQNLARPVEPTTPPRRKRGRPPKASLASVSNVKEPVDSPLFDAAFSAVAQNSPLSEFGAASSFVKPYPISSANRASFVPIEPVAREGANVEAPALPKRKRGRPRKNPAPALETTVRGTSVNQAPTNNAPFDATSNLQQKNVQSSFTEEFNRSLQRSELESEAARPKLAVELSEAERVAWAVGDFNDSVANAPNAPVQRVPGKRGRPKGSVNRRPAPINSFDDEAEVLRDVNGFTVVKRPKESAKVRLEADASTVRFASLRTFVEGYSNQLARRVADVAIAEPGAMNPIFVCGPTSVGKTHLLEGICDAYTRLPGVKPPLYMTSEEFTTAFIQSLRGNGSFRDRFKNISLLALDDVHFLEGKLSTQTELLNVVDYLRSRRVQMVFSANRPLSELSKLRGELTTRIESGVVCQINAPERETLAQIFRQTALQRNLVVPEEVCRYVVSRFATHARQLSGALNRLYATHLTTGAPIDVELAREALADLSGVNYRNVKLEDVERVVQETFEIGENTLKSSSRARKYADPRAIAMWLARKHTRSALAEIGEFFGGRRHTAVIFAQKKVDGWIKEGERLETGETVGETIERLERALTYSRS